MNHIQALQNAADTIGATVHSIFQEDKRKTVEKFCLYYNGNSIAPVLDYNQMQHYIQGMVKAKQIFINTGQVN